MSILIQVLLWNTVLLLLLLFWQGYLVAATHGFQWGLGSRDEPRTPSRAQGRAARTVDNHLQGIALFLPLCLIVELYDIGGALVVWGAALFLIGRIAFAGLYIGGVAVARSVAWGTSLLGLGLLFVAVFRFAYGGA